MLNTISKTYNVDRNHTDFTPFVLSSLALKSLGLSENMHMRKKFSTI